MKVRPQRVSLTLLKLVLGCLGATLLALPNSATAASVGVSPAPGITAGILYEDHPGEHNNLTVRPVGEEIPTHAGQVVFKDRRAIIVPSLEEGRLPLVPAVPAVPAVSGLQCTTIGLAAACPTLYPINNQGIMVSVRLSHGHNSVAVLGEFGPRVQIISIQCGPGFDVVEIETTDTLVNTNADCNVVEGP